MRRAVIYARVSTERQADEGLSVESQIEACRRRADELGAAVAAVYRDDGLSGTTDARPGFRQAIEHCRLGDIDYLLCWSSSRFARDQHDAITYKREISGFGTRLVYASQQLDLATHEGWLADSFQQIIDENYSRQVSLDTKRSMIKAARDGYFMGGRVPFGYSATPAPDGKRRRLQPHADEARLVRWIFEQCARGLGAFAIARACNRQGLTMRGRPWGKTTLLNILKSEVYMGQVIFNRFDRKRRTARPQAEWVRVQAHDAIVAPEEFAAAQRALQERAPAEGQAPGNTRHLFAGLLRCEHCGAGMKMTTGRGRNGTTYHYYGCNTAASGKGCRFKPMRADLFDAWLLGELLDRVLTRENVQAVIDQLDGAAVRWAQDRARRRAALVLELRTAEGRRGKLYEVLETQGRDAPGISELGPRLRELNEQIQRVELALVAVEDEAEPIVGRASSVSADEAARVMRRMVEECEDPKTLRAFVASFVERVIASEQQVLVEYHPECLIRDQRAMAVHSTEDWLPVRGLLRTASVVILRPITSGNGRPLRRAA